MRRNRRFQTLATAESTIEGGLSVEAGITLDWIRTMSVSLSDETRNGRVVAWPGWRHVGESYGLGTLFAIWLELIYGGTDYITGLRSSRVPVHFEWELAMPFAPAMTVFYVSILPFFWIGPFVLRTRREVLSFVACLSLATFCAGVVYLLIPSELAYSTPEVSGHWAPLYHAADAVNWNYNLLPSLHVTLSIICADIYSRRSNIAGKLFFWAWGFAISLSTLLTHMHHLLDVFTGFLLAMVVSRCCYDRWVTWRIRAPNHR